MDMDHKGLFKILLVGESKVGKTSLISRYVSNKFNETYAATIGADFVTKETPNATLQIWDTAGQERFKSLGAAFYRGTDLFVFVYDPSDDESLQKLSEHYTETQGSSDSASVVVVANKSDLLTDDAIDAPIIAGKRFPFFVTSAKTGKNVEAMFTSLVQKLTSRKALLFGDAAYKKAYVEDADISMFDFVEHPIDPFSTDIPFVLPEVDLVFISFCTTVQSGFETSSEVRNVVKWIDKHADAQDIVISLAGEARTNEAYAHVIRQWCQEKGCSVFIGMYDTMLDSKERSQLSDIHFNTNRPAPSRSPAAQLVWSKDVSKLGSKHVTMGIPSEGGPVDCYAVRWACACAYKHPCALMVDGCMHFSTTPIPGSANLEVLKTSPFQLNDILVAHTSGGSLPVKVVNLAWSWVEVSFPDQTRRKYVTGSPLIAPHTVTIGKDWEVSPDPSNKRVSWEEHATLKNLRLAPIRCFPMIDAFTCSLAGIISMLKQKVITVVGSETRTQRVTEWLFGQPISTDKRIDDKEIRTRSELPVDVASEGLLVFVAQDEDLNDVAGRAISITKSSADASILFLADRVNDKNTLLTGGDLEILKKKNVIVQDYQSSSGIGLYKAIERAVAHDAPKLERKGSDLYYE